MKWRPMMRLLLPLRPDGALLLLLFAILFLAMSNLAGSWYGWVHSDMNSLHQPICDNVYIYMYITHLMSYDMEADVGMADGASMEADEAASTPPQA